MLPWIFTTDQRKSVISKKKKEFDLPCHNGFYSITNYGIFLTSVSGREVGRQKPVIEAQDIFGKWLLSSKVTYFYWIWIMQKFVAKLYLSIVYLHFTLNYKITHKKFNIFFKKLFSFCIDRQRQIWISLQKVTH